MYLFFLIIELSEKDKLTTVVITCLFILIVLPIFALNILRQYLVHPSLELFYLSVT